jgi:hypothetical protein
LIQARIISVDIEKRKRKAETPLSLPSPNMVDGDYISPEEEDLHVAEAQILFPKYVEQCTNKRKSGRKGFSLAFC